MLALVGEFLPFPRLKNDLQGLGKPFLALVVSDAEYIIRPGETAAADAELEPALADVVDRGHFLGDA